MPLIDICLFELGKNNIENVNKVFSTSIIIHVVIAIFIFLLGETIGLWFLNTQMTIPADRMVAANWIYQRRFCHVWL